VSATRPRWGSSPCSPDSWSVEQRELCHLIKPSFTIGHYILKSITVIFIIIIIIIIIISSSSSSSSSSSLSSSKKQLFLIQPSLQGAIIWNGASVHLSVPLWPLRPKWKLVDTSNLEEIFFFKCLTEMLIYGHKGQSSRSHGSTQFSNWWCTITEKVCSEESVSQSVRKNTIKWNKMQVKCYSYSIS